MSATSFYILTSVVFLELLVIVMLLLNVRTLLKVEREKAAKADAVYVWKARFGQWWIKLNSFKSAEQEANIDLGHDYDGIREQVTTVHEANVRHGPPPEKVARAILRVLQSPKPRLHYTVTTGQELGVTWMKRLLPDWLTERLIRASYHMDEISKQKGE